MIHPDPPLRARLQPVAANGPARHDSNDDFAGAEKASLPKTA